MVLDWYTITIQALLGLWEGFIMLLPKIIGSLIILLLGWFIAVGVGRLVAEVLRRMKFNQIFQRGVWEEALEKAEIKVDPSGFIGNLVKWVLVIVFLLVAVEILGLFAFAGFLTTVLNYLANVIVAALIFVVAVVIADIAEKVARVGVESAKVGYGRVVGAIVKWAIWIFAIMAILRQLLIVPGMIDTLFNALVYGVVSLLVIAFGIAFGLGGREMATEILRDLKKKLGKQ